MRPRPLFWVAGSRRDLVRFPDRVRSVFGFALFRAQCGARHVDAKPLKGFSGASVVEVCADHDGDAFRAVYTVRFEEAVYVLHAFQKKSKSGIATPRAEMELIESRLRLAGEMHARWLAQRGEKR